MWFSLASLWQRYHSSGHEAVHSEPEADHPCAALSVSVSSTFRDVSGVQVNGGTINTAGRDIHINNCFHGTTRLLDLNLSSRIQDWLASDINYRSIQIDTFNKRTPGTGSWFIESEEFQQWLKSGPAILWGIGMPGAGKTVLASTVIDHLQALADNAKWGDISVAFIYYRYTDLISVKEILTSLIGQLLDRNPSLVPLIEPLHRKHEHDRTQPTQSELMSLLMEVSKALRTIFIVFDGLDEAPTEMQVELIRILSSLNSRVIITSRPLTTMEHRVPSAKIFQIVAQSQDIDLVISERIDRTPALQILLNHPTLKEEAMSAIRDQSGGMLLHACLQVDMLQQCLTVNQVRKVLKTFPLKIEELYASTMARVLTQPPTHVFVAKRVLVWLIFAYRSLSVVELQYALAACLETHTFDLDSIIHESILVSLCCGLITVDSESKLVRLIHFTAKDALQPFLRDEFLHPHALLGSTCVSRLISCQFPDSDILAKDKLYAAFKNRPFLEYAYDAWHLHARKCDPQSLSSNSIREFVRRCRSFPIFINFTRLSEALDYANSLQVAAFYDLIQFVDIDLDSDDRTPMHELTPLMLATIPHRPQIWGISDETALRLLQCPGVRSQINDALENGSRTLILASEAGLDRVVSRLLEFPELDLNAQNRIASRWTALLNASLNGHEPCVRQLLVDPRIEVNATDMHGRTALMVASRVGHDALVKLFLEHPDVQVNAVNKRGRTALMYAAFEGQLGVVRLLLEYPGVHVGAMNRNGLTALDLALERGHGEVAECIRVRMA